MTRQDKDILARASAPRRARRSLLGLALAGCAAIAGFGPGAAFAQAQGAAASPATGQAGKADTGDEKPGELIERVGNEIIERIKNDQAIREGNVDRLSQLVDELVMPYVNFERMTALAAGRWWRQATPEQRKALMTEFRAMLLRTYSGAMSAVGDQKIRMKPMRGADADATDLIVRSEIVQPGREPIQIDYRMQKTDSGWKIYDLNVLGVWIVETYRNQFNQEAARSGVDGLIKSLADKNREFGPKKEGA